MAASTGMGSGTEAPAASPGASPMTEAGASPAAGDMGSAGFIQVDATLLSELCALAGLGGAATSPAPAAESAAPAAESPAAAAGSPAPAEASPAA